MHLTLLGTAGWMPTERRETTCFACREGETLIVFDAGTGLRRLAAPAHRELADVEDVHIFLTHYHLDHVCGLAYLSGVLPDRRVTIHAPAREFTGVEPASALGDLLHKPYHPHNLLESTAVHIEPIGRRAVVADRVITTRPQRHSDLSLAYRVDDDVVLATDTTPDRETAVFAEGVKLLLHEAWYWRGDAALERGVPPSYTGHSDAESAAQIACAAGVDQLVLVHLNPLRSENDYLQLESAARAIHARTYVFADGEAVPTDAVLP